MIISVLFNRRKPAKIRNLTLDATLEEQHEFENEVTSFPVEVSGKGESVMSDHIRINPDKITISGVVSNTPLPGSKYQLNAYSESFSSSALGQSVQKDGGSPRALEALEELLDISGRGSNPVGLVDVVTGLKVYTDMALLSLSVPRDKGTGQALYFRATFVKVHLVQSESVQIDISNVNREDTKTQASSKKSTGNQSPKPATEKQSALVKMFDWGVRKFAK